MRRICPNRWLRTSTLPEGGTKLVSSAGGLLLQPAYLDELLGIGVNLEYELIDDMSPIPLQDDPIGVDFLVIGCNGDLEDRV